MVVLWVKGEGEVGGKVGKLGGTEYILGDAG